MSGSYRSLSSRRILRAARTVDTRPMKAIRFHEHGGPEVLRLDELSDLAPGPGQVRLRVRASALNHLDVDIREGGSRMALDLPHVPGFEVVGAVDAVGPGVDGAVRVGERVIPWAYDRW